MNKPNLIIVGAAKSGTTSLHHYLDQHDEVFMSKHKEPHFLINNEAGVNEIPNGIISLKGGNLEDELKYFKEKKVFDISDYFSEDFFKTKRIVYVPFSN